MRPWPPGAISPRLPPPYVSCRPPICVTLNAAKSLVPPGMRRDASLRSAWQVAGSCPPSRGTQRRVSVSTGKRPDASLHSASAARAGRSPAAPCPVESSDATVFRDGGVRCTTGEARIRQDERGSPAGPATAKKTGSRGRRNGPSPSLPWPGGDRELPDTNAPTGTIDNQVLANGSQ
jgi:hypothetical protein